MTITAHQNDAAIARDRERALADRTACDQVSTMGGHYRHGEVIHLGDAAVVELRTRAGTLAPAWAVVHPQAQGSRLYSSLNFAILAAVAARAGVPEQYYMTLAAARVLGVEGV